MDTTKKPRLFFWIEDLGAWIPSPNDIREVISPEDSFAHPGEVVEFMFKRIDMTDEEFLQLTKV